MSNHPKETEQTLVLNEVMLILSWQVIEIKATKKKKLDK